MLKKVAFVLALTVLVSFALALESGPSNTVGFVKFTAAAGDLYTAFGLPFTSWDVVAGVPSYGVVSSRPSDILGTQLNGGMPWVRDNVTRQDNGKIASRDAGGVWTGLLETDADMIVGRAYWIFNNDAAIPLEIVLAGEVDTFAWAPLTMNGPDLYTALSFRDARIRPVASINLLTCGFHTGMPWVKDQLVEQSSGDIASHSGTAWGGLLTQITPGEAYWIFNNGPDNWTYTYGPGTVAPPPERPDNNDGSIDRITRPTRRSRSLR